MNTQFEKDWRLFLAARDGNLKAGHEALIAGANPNFVEPKNRSSALLRAVAYGHTAFVKMLLDLGASLPVSKDDLKNLSFAARCANSPATLLLLLRSGLPPTRDDGDWAQERGYQEVQELVEQSLGPFVITYDIDELLAKPYNKFYYEFCLAVPENYSIHDPKIYLQERVIRDLWEFHCDTGSGFSSLIGNEHYDTVTRAYHALYEIRPSNCLQAVSELRDLLQRYGFPADAKKAVEHQCTLSEADRQAMEKEIEALDHRFFHYRGEDCLWQNPDYLDCGMEFARKHIEVFRKRKKN